MKKYYLNNQANIIQPEDNKKIYEIIGNNQPPKRRAWENYT